MIPNYDYTYEGPKPSNSVSDNFGGEAGSPATVVPPSVSLLHVAPTRGLWDVLTLGLAGAGAFFGWRAYQATRHARGRR
jgi:hypothetical protein